MIGSRKVTALLPMKAHSERVPNKNFKPFCGQPLYTRVLATLHRCAAVDEIIINTDSEVLMRDAPALSPKVRMHLRPEAIRGDGVSMNRIIENDLARAGTDIVLQTHSTNPLLKASTIQRALECFASDADHDSLFSVNTFQSRFYDQHGRPINHDPEVLLRTQDLPPVYEENSNLYVFTASSFAKRGRRIGERPRLFPVDRIEAIDIDDMVGFHIAETLAAYADLARD